MQFESEINGQTFEIKIDKNQSNAQINGMHIEYQIISKADGQFLLRSGTKTYKIDTISKDNKDIVFSVDGTFIKATVKNEQHLLLEQLGFKTDTEASLGQLNAPMPGKIIEVLVTPGNQVALGEPVMILEAMKMENELKAPTAGVLNTLHVSTGDNVEKNQPLLEILPRG